MGPHRISARRLSWITRIGLTALVALLVIVFTQERILRLGIFERLELATLDYRFQARGINTAVADSPHVVIVEISEDSFRSLDARFPWPRRYYAHLLRNLRAAGVRAVGIDLLLSSPDHDNPENDQELRTALRQTGIGVLAGKRESDNDAYVQTSLHPDYGNIFFPEDSSLGLVNIRNDPDGVYRGYNTMFIVDSASGRESAIPTLAFAVLNKSLGLPPRTVPHILDGRFQYAGRDFPRRSSGSLLINFYGPNGTFPHIKFQDVIDDASLTTAEEAASGEDINTFSDSTYGYLFDGTFKDKVVLVGVTVPEYKDLFPIAVARGQQKKDNLMYGVEIHANVIENILRNDFLQYQSLWSEIATTFLLVLVTFLVTSGMREVQTRRQALIVGLGLLFAACELFAIGVLAVVLFTSFSYILSVVSASLAVVGGYVMSTTYYYITERKERLLIKSMFSTYVNPTVVEELVTHPEKLVLGGRREELTVMFSDIEGFTSMSQGMEPEALVGILNEYLSVMSAIIFRNNGTLDKYEGDAIMAFWGAPLPQQDHALRACLSALEMQEALTALNSAARNHERPTIRIRIGINTGEMVVGNMGAVGKFAYTVIGDSVNLASRLEGANKEYRTGIMVSERTYDLVRDHILGRRLDRIAVRGRTQTVSTYELLRRRETQPDDSLTRFLARYEEGMMLYYERKWAKARAAFEEALSHRPDDFPTLIHIERTRTYEVTPPPEEWDGVFVMTSK
jgi:adenylate cyclase